MPDDNQQISRRLLDAYCQGDIEALLPLLDDNIVVHSLLTEAEQSDYHGHAGVRMWLASVLEVFPDWRPEPVDDRAVGDAVVTELRVSATATGSQVPIDSTFWHTAHLRDGTVTWFGFFRTEAEALAAAGAPPER